MNQHIEIDSKAREQEKQSSKLQIKYRKNIWTKDENDMLIQSIEKHGFKWKAIAEDLPNRNPSQCSQRWKRIKPNMKNRKWTSSEDTKLIQLIDQYPNKWALIATQIKGRTGRQIRERYINYLDPNINKSIFTKKEDQLIWKLYQELGSKWSQISLSLPGRPENVIKNRFYSYIRGKYGNKQNPYYIIARPEPFQSNQRSDTQLSLSNNLEEISHQSSKSIELELDNQQDRFIQPQFRNESQIQFSDSIILDQVYQNNLQMECIQKSESNLKYQNQTNCQQLFIDNMSIDSYFIF